MVACSRQRNRAGNACMTGAQAAPTAREARRPIRRKSVGRPIAEFANPPPSDPDLDAFLTDACVISRWEVRAYASRGCEAACLRAGLD